MDTPGRGTDYFVSYTSGKKKSNLSVYLPVIINLSVIPPDFSTNTNPPVSKKGIKKQTLKKY